MTAPGGSSPLLRGRATGRAPVGPVLTAPWVAVEWAGPLFRPALGAGGDIAGFVGAAVRGPVGRPQRLAAAAEFDALFGPPPPGGRLTHAVHGFFGNGGRTCWVVRTARDSRSATATTTDGPRIRFTARSPGRWADGLTVTLRPTGGPRFTLSLAAADGRTEVWRDQTVGTLPERFGAEASSAVTVSALVSAEVLEGADRPPVAFRVTLGGGDDGTVTTAGLVAGAGLFDDIEEIGLVALPDLVDPDPDAVADAQAALTAACEARGDRIALLHHPDPDADVDAVTAWRDRFHSPFAALHWPWLRIPDPARSGEVIAVPPCGHVAGVIARCDLAVGPWKPPANEIVAGVVGLTVPVDDDRHGRVNAASVNAIRAMPGRGIRVMGDRTTSREARWRYLHARRLVSAVERALAAEAAWLVFEPDAEALRTDLDRLIRQYLDDLWRAGGLAGATAAEAYEVTIDPAGADEGRLVATIGLRPPAPAEFVVIRIDLAGADTRTGGDGGDRGRDR
uniref:phage tail sheath family protein n=1 Tax=Paractinoplanes polyasparticus TaxID=2856853 RepID=UPI001C844DD3|nr:phage tail sheath subtilisin-like domain-containing protein [Actinoplanes polyasparticus]